MKCGTFILSCILGALFAITLPVQAAVTIDTTSSAGVFNAAGAATLTWSHQTGNNPNKALFVGISTATTTLPVGVPANRVAGVTYNGVVLTRVGTVISPNSLNTSEIFRLVNPQNGNHQIIVTFSVVPGIGTPFVNYAVGGAMTLHGVSQTTPNGAFFGASGSGTTATAAVTDSVSGDLVLDTLAVSPNAIFVAPDALQTQQWDGQGFFGNGFDVGAGSTKAAVSNTTTMNWTLTSADSWALGAIAVKAPVITAGTVAVGGRVTTKEGRGVGKAQILMTGANGETRTALTNPFGYFYFEDVFAGEIYIFSIHSKRYVFTPQAVFIGEERDDLNFFVGQ